MKDGLSKAISDETIFPYEDGRVELTVVQFGDFESELSGSTPHAQVEIAPVLITDDKNDPFGYYKNISKDIKSIDQLKGFTPMGCGIRLASDQLHDIGDFSVDKRQIILLVTDGLANCDWIPGTYNATKEDYSIGKTSTEEARAYLIDILEMNAKNDEFDTLAVGPVPDIDWLNNSIVWPEPGYIAPPFTNNTGWVSQVDNWKEFADHIEIIFKVIFNSIANSVELVSSTTIDPNDSNNYASVMIVPTE
jgi:hypothetical protein